MTAKYNPLLLAAMHRHGKPCTSDELTEIATGEAIAAGWEQADLSDLSRQSVAQRLRHLQKQGKVRHVAWRKDRQHSGVSTAVWALVDGAGEMDVPEPPQERALHAKSSHIRRQTLALLKHQDQAMAEVMAFAAGMQKVNRELRAELARLESEA